MVSSNVQLHRTRIVKGWAFREHTQAEVEAIRHYLETGDVTRLPESYKRLALESVVAPDPYHVEVVDGWYIDPKTCRNKSAYTERWAAIRAARRMMQRSDDANDRLVVFVCSNCRFYHLGRLDETEKWRRA